MDELRRRIHARLLAGDSPTDVAKQFSVSRSTVYRTKDLFAATGGYAQRPIPGRPKSTCTKANIEAVEAEIKKDPCVNIRKMSRTLNIDKTAISRIVKHDLGMKSRAVMKVQGLMAIQRERHLDRCRILLSKLKKGRDGKVLVFSDEKIFTVDTVSNSRTLRYIAKSPEDVPPSVKFTGRTKFPASAMMLGVVGSDGKAFPPYWVDGTMDAAKYKKFLAYKVFPALDATYGCDGWIWTQDGAPAHTSKAIQSYLVRRLGSRGFWSKTEWPPNSPNLNPLDFFIWGAVERTACATYHSSVAELKKSVEEHWAKMPSATLRKVCGRFRTRLEACIRAEGGIFEK